MTQKSEEQHRPVMVKELLEAFATKNIGKLVDCTVGLGGHSLALLQNLPAGTQLLGIDLDPIAIAHAKKNLGKFSNCVKLECGNFASLLSICRNNSFTNIGCIIFDLGLSSAQIESSKRGFTFSKEEPLDMRFSPKEPQTAHNIVNNYNEKTLRKILYDFGEERSAKRITKAILANRPIHSSLQLSEIIKSAKKYTRRGLHPATKTFQALRIEVNGELENLKQGLSDSVQLVEPGGRIAVISYHSLEDRIVKQFFKEASSACICPPEMPICSCNHKATVRTIYKKIIRPSTLEIAENPRSRSAKLRVAEKIECKTN